MSPSEAAPNIQVVIGGFVFSLSTPNQLNADLPDDYAHFISEGVPQVKLNVISTAIGKTDHGGNLIFDAGTNWQMHRYTEATRITTMFHQAYCSHDFSRVDIYPAEGQGPFTSLAEALVYPLPEIITINLLGRNSGILLHACGVLDQGGVHLFCGMSGAGKSTLANLWHGHSKTSILSDDRIIARCVDGRWMAFGTPWHGEAGHASAASAPIKNIFFIEHAQETHAAELTMGSAVSSLLARSFPPLWDKELMDNSLEYAHSLLSTVPSCVLGVKPDAHIIDFVRQKAS